MESEELRQLVAEVQRQQMELESIEVKCARGGTPKAFDSLSSLSNRPGGGVILFGLDEGESYGVTGVGDPQRVQEDVSSWARSEMEPPLNVLFTVVEIDGETVVAVEVPEIPREQKPCYYRNRGLKGNGGAYIRSGNTDRPMSDYEIFTYISSRGQPTDDEERIADATLDDLDAVKLNAHLEHLRSTRPKLSFLTGPREETLTRLRVVREVDGVLRPTLAGLLTFGEYPQEFLPQLFIAFVQYYGTTEHEKGPGGQRFLDNRKFEGPIPEMLNAAERYVVGAMRKSSLIESTRRKDIPEYPQEALREALANAVAHRDYSQYVRGSYIQVRMFADRLEVQSPGGLFGKVTEENIEEEESTRNARLMQMLEDTHIVENRGSGIDAMIAAMRQANMEPPRFRDSRASFVVTLRNHTLMSPATIQWLNQFAYQPLNDRQRVALAYLRANERIVNNDYCRLNQVDVVTAGQELRGLVQIGLIQQNSASRWTYYTLGVSSEEGAATVSQPESDEDRILNYVREKGSINNTECQGLLGVGDTRAYYLLRKLCDQGKLRPKGPRKGRRYVAT
ncbi:MAG: putative DNA binding domain-containing protein [Pirellulaceae bacterium]|nr:putative DNA binding domain-containing protein [Pirellulaceae bacterium]